MSTGFKDHFSGHAGQYAAARPGYPESLFAWLASLTDEHELAWDAGCGNGQASGGLQPYFRRILACDASAEQIARARPQAGIEYLVAPAEACPLDARSCDLVVSAQAAHWFDLPAFMAEVRRVLKPGGAIALWCYELARVSEPVDRLVDGLYRQLDPDWPRERRLVESGYRTIAFPFREIEAPEFALRQTWRCGEYLAYLRSWSATQRHRRRTGTDPVERVAAAMAEAWGVQVREVRWPLSMRVGYATAGRA